MPGNGDSEGPVSRADLTRLAELFDMWNYALPPHDESSREARSEFNDLVIQIYDGQVKLKPEFSGITLTRFETLVREKCRQFLKKRANQ